MVLRVLVLFWSLRIHLLTRCVDFQADLELVPRQLLHGIPTPFPHLSLPLSVVVCNGKDTQYGRSIVSHVKETQWRLWPNRAVVPQRPS